jgi:AcrR family transcriptional regulator
MTTTSPGSTPGLRERHRIRIRQALRDAARRLVTERGFDAVTVEQIATAADVSRRTFFNYFDSKEAAVIDPDPEVIDRIISALTARPADESPLRSLRAVLSGWLSRGMTEHHTVSTLATSHPALSLRYQAMSNQIGAAMATWAAQRTGLDPEISPYPELFAVVAQSTVRLTAQRWPQAGGDSHPVTAVEEILDLFEAGLDPHAAHTPGRARP